LDLGYLLPQHVNPVLDASVQATKLYPSQSTPNGYRYLRLLRKKLGYAKGVTAKRTIGKRLPSPKKRLCKVHGRPIRPGRWRSGHRTTGCADCYRTKNMPPPNKRLCKEHKLPIMRQRWWSGYRNKGCPRCFKVPPPKKRLCRKHHQPIQPSSWLRGRHSTGCSRCHNSRPGYRRAKVRYTQRLRQETKVRKKRR
jgi:hypothetical protein